MRTRQSGRRARRTTARSARYAIETLERRLLLTGTHEQALLNAIDAELQPSNPTGLTAFNSELKGSSALGVNLPVVGTGISAYDPGTALAGLLGRLGSSYSSVGSLVTALQNGTGIVVSSSSDLLDDVQLAVQFNTSTNVSVPINANYGVTLVDPGALNMSVTLSENLTIGAYWDANSSSAAFYVGADSASIKVAGGVTSVSVPPAAWQLGFIQMAAGGISSVSFSPTFSFALNEQPPVDSAEAAGRLTSSQLSGVPIATLVSTQVSQPAAATVTVAVATSLAPSASQITFSWPNINSPSTVSSTLTTDPTLAQLNQLQSINPLTIASGLDEVTEDLAAAATTTTTSPTNPFYTNLPLLGESINNLVNFPITSGGSDPYSIFQTYLTNYTDPVSTTTSAQVSTFATDYQLVQLIDGIPGHVAGVGEEPANGSQLSFGLDLQITLHPAAPSFPGFNVSPQLNIANSDFNLVPTVQVAVNLIFGVDASTGNFFVTASSIPAVQVNVTATGTAHSTADLGMLGVDITGGTLQLNSTAGVTLFDPQTDSPPTPGIITGHELMFGPQPVGPGGSIVTVPMPATVAMSGTASVNLPISVDGTLIGGSQLDLGPQTINISWPNVSQPATYTFNTSSLGAYLGWNSLTAANMSVALTQVESALNDLSQSEALGQEIALIGTNLGADVTLGTMLQNDVQPFSDFQTLYSQLVAALGAANVPLSGSATNLVLGIDVSQPFSGSLGWSVDHPVAGAEFAASGSVPVTGQYYADIPLGIVLTPGVTPANQFYILGGQDFGGNVYADTTGLSGPASLGTASLTFAGGTLEIAATNTSGQLETSVPAPFNLSLGTGSTEQISLSALLAAPQSYFGPVTFSSAGAVLKLPLSGLPHPGTNPEVDFAWSNPGLPSTLTVTPSNLGDISSTMSFSVQNFLNGVSALLTEVGTWQNSSILQTDLPWIDETIFKLVPFISNYQTVLGQIKGLSGSDVTTLNNQILNLSSSLPAGMSIAGTSNDKPAQNDLEYNLNFNIVNQVVPVPFAVGAGFDSLFSLYNTNVNVTVNSSTSLTFGFDPADGFYVLGNSSSSTPQFSVSANDVNQHFSNKTPGIFGTLPMGVTGAVVNLSAAYGLNLLPPGDNGSKIATKELSKAGLAVLQPTVSGSGSITLPFGLQLGGSTSTTATYASGGGPGITSTFTASWNPANVQAMEFGSGNSTAPVDGFGAIDFDLDEFVNDMIGPYLRAIDQYNPIPQALLDALDYQIPIIDRTPLELLADYTGDTSISDLSAMLQILNLVNQLPSENNQLDLSSYLVGAPATGDAGAVDGGASGSESNIENGIITTLQNYYITMPVLSDPQNALAQTLLGQDVTLVQFEPGNNGYISYTAGWNTPTIPVPIVDLGILSINATFSGGVSATIFGNIDIGLTTRGLLGQEIGGGGPNLLDGFFIDDTQQYQMGLKIEAHISIGGELAVAGLSVASITGSIGPEGTFGIHANDVYYAPHSNIPLGIADYQGAPPGDGKVYLDELQWIASRYGILCAIMPESSVGVQITISASILGFSFTIFSHDYVITEWNVPCVPAAATVGTILGNTLTMNGSLLNTGGASTGSPNTISASVWYDNNGNPQGLQLTETNQALSYYQDFSYAQLAGVTTLVMNGTEGSDTFYFDPNLTEPNFVLGNSQSSSTVELQYLKVITLDGKDTANFANMTTKNSDLLGLTIMGGSGNDYFEGNYSPDLITLGSGTNFAYIGTGEGEVVEGDGADTINGGNGNDTVIGGNGSASISLGDGNNVINEGPGTATIKLGNGNNLITSSSQVYNSGITSNGSSLAGAAAPDGSQAAFLQGNSSITQNINDLISGDTFTLSFSAAQAAGNTANEDFEVLMDNTVAGTFNPTSTTYQTFTATLNPTGSVNSHYITFKGLDTAGGNNAVLIDNVQFTGVSEPAPDGGFETPPQTGNGYQTDPGGSAWTFSGTAGISANDSLLTSGNPIAPEGSQVAFIQNQGSFTQNISGLSPFGGTYALTFDMAQSALSTSNGEDFQVLVNGNLVATINPSSTSYASYTTLSFGVVTSGFSVTFKGLDTLGGNNTAFIDNVQVDLGNAPLVTDGSFELPPVVAGTFIANDVVPNPSLAAQLIGGTTTSSGWLFIAGIGEDTITVGNGNNTIHGDIGGSIIQTGSGQNIIYAGGAGADNIIGGGGNNFVSINLDVAPVLQIPSGMFAPVSPTFTVDGGAGRTLLDVQANGTLTLTNNSVVLGTLSNPVTAVQFTDIASVALAGGGGSVTFDVSRWTGSPVQISGGGGSATIVSSNATNFILSDNSLSRSDGTSFAFSGIGTADLTSGAAYSSFDVSGWHGGGVIDGTGSNSTLIASGLASATLSNSLFQRAGTLSLTLTGINLADLTSVLGGSATINATAFSGNVALFGQGSNNTLEGGSGSNYIVGGPGAGNLLIGNGLTDNEIVGGPGSNDTIDGSAGENILVSSNGGGDTITTGPGTSRVYMPGKNNTINAQGGNAIVYLATSGNSVNTGSSTTDQVLNPGQAGTTASDFVAPSTSDLWEFPPSPAGSPTLPTGTAAPGQWVQLGTSASGGGVSGSPGSAIAPSVVAAGSGASSVQYVAWADNRSGTYEIYVARYSSSGWSQLAGSAQGGGISNGGSSTQPSIALDTAGYPVVAWSEAGNIYVAEYNPSANSGQGGWVALGTSLSAGGISNTGAAQAAQIVNTSSGPVVAWLDTSGGASNVFIREFNGTTWTTVGSGSASGHGVTGSSSAVTSFSLATDGTKLAIAWTQPGTSAGNSIYVIQNTGSGWSGVQGANTGNGISGTFAAQSPTLAYAGGSLYAAWAANTDGTTNIVAAVAGTTSWQPMSIDTPASAGANQVSRGAASNPVLSSNGTALELVWTEDRLPSTPYEAVAIYANELVSGQFVRQLAGDASFDGVFGRSTSLSQPAGLGVAVDGAGHPFVVWPDSSSGSAQIYMLGNTLNIHQIIYVSDTSGPQDSYTTQAGSSLFNGLSPSTPLPTIQAALNLATIAPGDVILVDTGSYGGFTVTSADNGVLIIGAPGGTTDITGAVNVNGAQNLELQWLQLGGGATLNGDTNVQLNDDTGGPAALMTLGVGGSITVSGGSGLTLNGDAFVGLTASGGASGLTLAGSQLPGTGLTLSGSVTGLSATDTQLESLSIAAASQGVIAGNNISGGGLNISAGFTGSIAGNFIHGAQTGVNLTALAPFSGNQIFRNHVGVVVSGGGSLGFLAGSSPNYIWNNGVGVQLAGAIQGQDIFDNETGVTGSGTLGGTSLALANQIQGNATGINFNGTVQYNRIDYNENSITVQNGQLIAHNLFYDNKAQNLQTLGASSIEIVNNSFYSPAVTNVFVNGGSSDVEVLNNILWAGGGYDLDIANDSRTGYFSDYNDLYTTGGGQIVHYLTDFGDILDWQDDVNLYDLHSIGTTVVNPTLDQPQFVNLGFNDLSVLPTLAGIRNTSPTIGTGDPESDLALPLTVYNNLLSNASFESGTTGWTVNSGGATQSASPPAFDGSNYFYSGAVASGFAQQTISLLSDGFTAAQLDAQNLDISFGGRIRSANESPADQGQIVVTFLDGSSNVIGTPTTVSASNVSDRWELVGGRVHIPQGARSITYRFQSTRESGSTDDSYLDAAFLYVLSNTTATDMGAYGASYDTAGNPIDQKIQLQTPDLYVNWTLTQSHNILWSTFGNTGDSPVRIDLYQQTSGGLTLLTNITPSTADSGSYAWVPQSSGLTYGTYGLRIKVSLVGNSAIQDFSTENFTIPENGNVYYVNDNSRTGDQYTTAVGNNRATGKIPSAPLPLLTTLMRSYAPGPNTTVYVDTGTYYDFAPVELSGNPAIGNGSGVTIVGPVPGGGASATINAFGFTSPAVVDVNDADFVTLTNLGFAGANYGVWVRDASANFTGQYLTATGNSLSGIRLEADSTAGAVLTHITADNNTGDGLYAGGPIVSLTNSVAYNNTGDGFDFANAGAAVLTNDIAYGNAIGLNVINTTGGTTTTVGNANLALGLGNQFYNNQVDGIVANGSVVLAGNIAYGQSATGDAGIVLLGGATATENIVHDNYDGILSATNPLSITFNLAYSNSNIGIEGDVGATLTGNVAYSNPVGIRSMSPPNAGYGPYITNNLVYNNSVQGIWLTGGNNATFYNNTVYQPAGDALHIDAYTGLPASGIQIENNILWTQNGFDISLDPTSENGFKSDYNDLYYTAGGKVGKWETVGQATLINWLTATANDADSISVDPLFVNVAGGDYHEQSLAGSFHNGSLAPVIGGSGLPVTAAGTRTADSAESPAIDRGDPSFSFTNEPSPNGGYINLGAYGNTAQASLSPTSYVLVLKPAAGQTLVEGQKFTIVWRSQDMSGTVNIDLLQGGTTLSIVAGVSNTGSYTWTIPTSITPGAYTIRVTRNAAPTAVGLSGTISLSTAEVNYYVNGSSTAGTFTTAGGSDANSGLDPAHPKATIGNLLASYQLGSGDTIFIDQGTYNLSSNVVLTSTNNGLTIEGVSGGGTVLDRTNSAAGSYVFDLQGASNVTLQSLSITGGQYGLNASNGAGSTGLKVTSSFFYGSQQIGINLGSGNGGAQITSSTFHDMVGSTIAGIETSGDQVTVSGDTAYNLGFYGFYIVNANNSTISGNIAYNDGIGIYTDVSTVSGNIAYNDPNAGILIAGNSTVTGNTTYNNISTKSINGFPQAGIELGGGTANGNISYGNVYGIYFTGNTATASDNRVYNNSTAGISGGNAATILGNVLYGNGLGISSFSNPSAAATGPVIENNLLYNNITGGIYLVGGDTTPILNNTIYQTTGDGLQIVVYTPTNNVQVRDNIFWNSAGPDISVDSGSEEGVQLDYNDLYAVSTGAIGSWGGTTYATLAAWQGATGMDAHSISADPLFVNAAAFDFHEQSLNGSYHGGTLAPTLNTTTGLPQANPGTLTDDASESPAIDRGNPADSYSNEPSPNGGYVNLGAYGNSIQASLSPQHYLFITNPVAGQTVAAGQGLTILWRDEVANTGVGAGDTDTLQLLGSNNNNIVLTTSASDTGSYVWSLPSSLASGTYEVRVIRNDGTGLTATSLGFNIAAFDGIYYVNGSSTGGVFTTAGGNDSNSGTDPAHPKATIGAIFASYTVQPGNVIMVDSATYNLTSNMVLTAADDGITIEGAGGGMTILNRGSTTSGSYVFDIQGATNLTLEGLTFSGAYVGVNASYGNISSGLTVTNCTFVGNQYIGIDLQGSNGTATISNNSFEGALDGTFGGSAGLYSQQNVTVANGNIAYGMSYGLEINGGTTAAGATIDNNTAYKNNTGIFVISSNTGTWAVNANTSYDNFQTNLTLSGSLIASGNIVYQDGGAGSNEVSIEEGFNIANGPVVTNSVIYGNVIGIEMANGATASGNRVYDNSGGGIVLTSQDTVIGNDVYSNGKWGILYSNNGGVATTIANNLVYANATGGIDLSNAYLVQVSNNTVYQTSGPAVEVDGTGSYSSGVFNPTVNLQNNILWTTAGPDVNVADGMEEGFTSDYNDLYFTATGEVAQMAGVNFTTLSSWAWELGLDTHGISVDPQFVNPSGPDGLLGYTGAIYTGTDHGADDDFHLQLTSPAIDAGNPASTYFNEPAPNGGRINLGNFGNTSQADPSPAAQSVQITSPSNLQKLEAGHQYTLSWQTAGVTANQPVLLMDTGGPTVGYWTADSFSTVSENTRTVSNTIDTSGVTSPAPQQVYQSYAWASPELAYDLPVPNGSYTLRLHFMDDVGYVGQQVMNIKINGVVVQSNYSPYASAGAGYKATAVSLPVTASGGAGLLVELVAVSGYAVLSGIELTAANPSPVPSPTANLQLSTDSGATWSNIVVNQPLDAWGRGSYLWTPSVTTAGPTALFRVSINTTSLVGTSQPFGIYNGGADYYVNDSSTVGDVYTTAVGNNANSGKSPNAPMASIEAIINDYHPGAGDTIFVDNGTYTLFHNIDIPIADSGLTIEGPAASGATAAINRNNSSTSIDFAFSLFNDGTANVALEDLSITGAYIGVNASYRSSSFDVGINGITISNNQIYSNSDEGILTGDNFNWTAAGNVVHNNGNYGIYIQGTTATITNNTVYNEPVDGIFFSTPVSGTTVSANVVSGNTVYGNGTGIYVDGVTVTGNFVHDNTSMGIYADTYSVVSGNTVWRQTATNEVGIEVSNATVSANAVFGNYNGVLVNGGEGIHAYGNRIYSNTNYGLLLENVNGSAYSIGYNYVATAYSNLIYANSTGGVFISSPYDLSLLNNTIYQLVGSAVVLSGSITTTYPLTIENNILWVQAGDDLDLTSTSTQPGLISDYNILDHTGASAYVGVWNGTSESTLAAWHAASALDSHSSDADPSFVDPAGADAVLGYNAAAQNGNGYNGGSDDNFFVAAGSPAIGAGNHAVAPPTDLLGYTFNASPDIGAYAYRGTAADSTPPTVTSVIPGASQITVVFSQIPNDIDAAASSLYVVRGAGPDGVFGTSDDVIYSVTSSYQTGTSQAVLSVNGEPLPNGLYQLTILSNASASVHNRAGVALDGNNDGIPGGNYVTSFTLGPSIDVINGTGGSDTITLTRDADSTDIDWTLGATVGKLSITDPNGLTINANGGNETLVLNPANGNPLPALLRLNGTFTINGLSGSNPLANTTLDIVRSTVFISYGASNPLALIQQDLHNGYNGGLWNGTPTVSTGVITSSAAAQNASQTTAVGYADSADGLISGQPVNTIELKYTLYGDTGLTGSVGFNAFTRLTQHYNQTSGATWDTGDFNYDGSVNSADFTLLTRTYNTTLTSLPTLDTISGTAVVDQITLKQDPDRQHVDWTMGPLTAQLADTDPNGLTINGNGGNDVITLDYRNGNPLPGTLHLNGTFTINGLQGSNPLANTNLEIGRSTVFISYSSSDPISMIQAYLRNGYNSGAWNGIPTTSTGVITSSPAAQNAAQTTAIGYADSADGLIAGQPVNTIELKYTLYGDTTLGGSVGFNNFTRLTQHYNQTSGGTWDTGDFNYDGSVNSTDFTLMTRTYNTNLGSQAVPAIAPISPTSPSAPVSPKTPQPYPTSITSNPVPPAPSIATHHPVPKKRLKHRK